MRTMGNGRTTSHQRTIRNVNELTAERVHGDVMTYQLPPEELAKYKAMKKPKKEDNFLVWKGR